MIPTFLGITLVNFGFVQLAPGGPVESFIAKIKFSGAGDGGGAAGGSGGSSAVGGGAGEGNKSVVTQEVIEELKKRYGFDKPIYERYWIWLRNTVTLEFGYSYA